jgi:hypothetical protein
MLLIEPRASLREIEEALREAVRWWNGQQANPKYRDHAAEALARLAEARTIFFDPMRRQAYDRSLQILRHAHREARWQPIRDLMAVLVATQGRFTLAQEDLVIRCARHRGLEEEEIERLLQEETLHLGVKRPPRLLDDLSQRHPPKLQHGYRLAMVLLSLSAVSLALMPIFSLTRPAILLMVPLINDIRLWVRGITFFQRKHESLSAWEWLSGIMILGGSTFAAIFDMWQHPFLPLGLISVLLIWSLWLLLTVLWKETPLVQSSDESEGM